MSEQPSAPPAFVKAVVKGVVRHAMTGAAGALATAGIIQTNQQTSFVEIGISIALWGFGLWWSAIQKKEAKASSPQSTAG